MTQEDRQRLIQQGRKVIQCRWINRNELPKRMTGSWCRDCGPFRGALVFAPLTQQYDGDLDEIVDEI